MQTPLWTRPQDLIAARQQRATLFPDFVIMGMVIFLKGHVDFFLFLEH